MLVEKRSQRLISAIHQYQATRTKRGPAAKARAFIAKARIEFWTIIAACDINRDANIPKSTRIPHPTGVVIHRETVIGENCLIMQQVTLGQTAQPGAPTLGNNVYIGAGARVLGKITIGDNARIGANAVVLNDVPPNSTAVGVPAKIIQRQHTPSA